MSDELTEKIAEAGLERGLGTLADFYEGLENVPRELLNRQWVFELAWAEYLLSLARPEIEREEREKALRLLPDIGYFLEGGIAGRDDKINDVLDFVDAPEEDGYLVFISSETFQALKGENKTAESTQDDFVPPAGLTHDNGW